MLSKEEVQELRDSLKGDELLIELHWYDACGTHFAIGCQPTEEYPKALHKLQNWMMTTLFSKGLITLDELKECRENRPKVES